MKLNLKKATLIKRYKRFLADVILEDGSEVTIHVANTGAMTGCATPNDSVFYSTSDNPKRKYPYSWEVSKTVEDHWICVNTLRANQLAEQAIVDGKIVECTQYISLQREVKYGDEKSKIDILLTDEHGKKTYIEVKSVTLLGNESSEKNETTHGQGFFPDAVTTRGQKHLRELMLLTKQGHRAILLFAVLHSGIKKVSPAIHIDEKYSLLLKQAKAQGVEILAYKADFSLINEDLVFSLNKAIPVKIS